jgi:hypothetical protein
VGLPALPDKLHYVVTFDDDPDFTSVTLYFRTSATPPDQAGLAQGFSINQTQKVGPGKFEVEGTIPDSAVTGSDDMAALSNPTHCFIQAAASTLTNSFVPFRPVSLSQTGRFLVPCEVECREWAT